MKDKKKMEKMMEEMMMKDQDSMTPDRKKAKLRVLGDISDEMKEMMSSDLDSMKKVTVAGQDDEALMMGLERAKELMEDMREDEDDEEEMEY